MISYIFHICRQVRAVMLIGFLFAGITTALQAQTGGLPFTTLELENLDPFDSPTSNWVISGDVFMNLLERHDVQPESGTGVLVNTSEGDSPEDIYTVWKHGDIDLELEFMMAKESNSGIYLQGRYEVQLLDSWGVVNPGFYDLGGVYQWSENGRGVGGIPPRVNAARAPGTWQQMEIKFRAPRFDADGEKIAHARLDEVILNGVMIHRNVDLIHPTGGAMSNEETDKASLRFQGDHGPVAFRNIRYKKYEDASVELHELSYRYFEGEFESAGDVEQEHSAREGTAEKLSLNVVPSSNEFGVIYEGEIQIEKEGDYFFELRTDGGNRLSIDGDVLIENDDDTRRGDASTATISLSEGSYPFELIYFRGARGGQPVLALRAEGPGIIMHDLQDASSFPTGRESIPFLVEPVKEPIVFHGFMDMGERVHTHTAAVGYPGGVNFAFDQNSGALMKIWKGDFVNAATMWVGRGGGNLSLNEDAAITITGAPSLAYLNNEEAVWPDSLQDGMDYRLNSYQFDGEGRLTFSYELDGVDIEDRIIPANENRELERSITFESVASNEDLYFRIAKGENISWMPNGLYQVDDKTYFIRLDRENRRSAWIRSSGGGQELVIPVSDNDEFTLNYSYIW